MNNVRTDLALEAHELCAKDGECDGISVLKRDGDGVFVTEIFVTSKKGEKAIGKPQGRYITVDAPDIKYSEEVYRSACRAVSREIRELCEINENTKTLVVGLGNDQITPDALGPETVSKLLVTNHLKNRAEGFFCAECGAVCAIVPGVLGTTGIETAEIIKGVSERVRPDLIICVDALAARDINRISTTFQLCDTGISPGSGVENKRSEISRRTMGVNVIAIGVPTVVDAVTLAADSIDRALSKSNEKNAARVRDELVAAMAKNPNNLMVTPKDIDLVIMRAAKTVANGINLALNGNLSLEDVENYVG